jgi:hypothetical protein
MLKIGCFWVFIILSLICIINQNILLFGLRLCIFCFTAVIMPNFFFGLTGIKAFMNFCL